jgi:hypothetical protein
MNVFASGLSKVLLQVICRAFSKFPRAIGCSVSGLLTCKLGVPNALGDSVIELHDAKFMTWHFGQPPW